MSVRLDAIKQKLNDSRAELNEALNLIDDAGDQQIYSEGAQWTVCQLVIHLALADRGHNGMVQHYAEGKEFIPADYDIERYNKGSVEKRADTTVEQARDMLNQSRTKLLQWIDGVEDDAFLDNIGRYPNLQMLTVAEIFDSMCRHELGHAKDIQTLFETT